MLNMFLLATSLLRRSQHLAHRPLTDSQPLGGALDRARLSVHLAHSPTEGLVRDVRAKRQTSSLEVLGHSRPVEAHPLGDLVHREALVTERHHLLHDRTARVTVEPRPRWVVLDRGAWVRSSLRLDTSARRAGPNRGSGVISDPGLAPVAIELRLQPDG